MKIPSSDPTICLRLTPYTTPHGDTRWFVRSLRHNDSDGATPAEAIHAALIRAERTADALRAELARLEAP
jgi:hypothetical protein